MTLKMNATNKLGILVAEDSRTQAEQLCYLLEQHGYRVNIAANGRAAFDAALAQKPALIISDIMMPLMDGYELCKAIKSHEKLKDIPIILVTSLSDPHDVIRGLECGADNFVRKPYDGDYLVSRINYLLMNHELRKNQKMQFGVEIDLNGHKHFITAERQQILDLLISTYEQAVCVNKELVLRDRELQGYNQMLNGLYHIADGLNQADTEQAVAETVLERAMKLPGIQAGWVWLRDHESNFHLAAACNLPAELNAVATAASASCACQRMLLADKLGNAVNIVECARFTDTLHTCHHASIPLWTNRHYALGVMNLISSGYGLFDEKILNILFGIGNQVAVALERARLHEHLECLVEERTAKLEAEVMERIRIQEKQARLVAIIEATPDLVATASLDGLTLYCNPAGRRMLGFDQPIDSATVNVFDAYPEWVARQVRAEGIPYAIERGIWSGETVMLGACGREVPVLQVIIAHKGHDGTVAYLSTIAHDITKRKQEEYAMQQLNETLEKKVAVRTADLELARQMAEEASRAKSSFLATMSHEIRTPMNGVIGMVDVLHQTSLKGYQVEMVELIRESAYALLGIIDDILDFSKIEAGKLELEQVPTSVGEVVEKVCEMLDRLSEKKKVELTLFTDPMLPQQVLSDPGRLRQILVNLINNAIKFSGDREQPGWVSVRAMLAERHADRVITEISIADNGIGMNEETLSGLFTAFTQADVSTTRHFGGTGLGLAIVHRLVELMDGKIIVRSTQGRGAVFTVRLPLIALPDGDPAESPVAGLSCLVIGESQGFADDCMDAKARAAHGAIVDDVSVYLSHGGAMVERAPRLSMVPKRDGAASQDLWIWIIDFPGESPPLDELRAIAHIRLQHEVRFVVIMRGQRRKPRRVDSDMVLVDGNVLTRTTILKAVAIAAGRLQEEEQAIRIEKSEAEFSPPSRAECLQQGRLILVAEDNKTNQKVILRQLALLGVAADIADNGMMALEHWRTGDYALLLTDLHMPRMDGYALTLAIRAEEQGVRRMPIVALTANALKGEAEHCHAVGMDDYLSKPVQLVQLQAVLEKWLPAATDVSSDPSVPSTVATPVDISVLKALVGNDTTVVSELLEDFRSNVLTTGMEVKTAHEQGRLAELSALAHKLKSSARSVGAVALGDLCAQLELAGKSGQIEALAALLPRFAAEVAVVYDYLEQSKDPPC